VEIRNYRPGDEETQAAIYNEAAGRLPRFKPATLADVQRRCRARGFDPGACFYAEEGSQVVGYATFQANGRVSFPWCLPGHETAAEPLFQSVRKAMQARGHHRAFAAYRGDWPEVHAFFEAHGFRRARDMVNFVLDRSDLPAPPVKGGKTVDGLQPRDVGAVQAMAPGALRVPAAAELEQHLLHNPYFAGDSVFVLRERERGEPLAVGLFIDNPTYADPRQVDAAMPCFRLGAFGTEGMTTKRIHGLFSFLAPEGPSVTLRGLELLQHAALQEPSKDLRTFAAQVPSDAPHLLHFYESHFRAQGSFPIFEKLL
jgi:hypothetical protein